MAVPTDYDLEYDDYCGTYTPYNCELPSVCPDAMSYSANRRTFCRDIRMLDDLVVEEKIETDRLVIKEEYLEIYNCIRFEPRQISTLSGSVYVLAVSPRDLESLKCAQEFASKPKEEDNNNFGNSAMVVTTDDG